MDLRIKRIYEAPASEDGYRVLVDRLWPRGLAKEKAAVDRWLRELAPSTGLRQWYGHDPARWDEFRRRYFAELAVAPAAAAVDELRALISAHRPLTLLYSSREETLNNAAALREYLLRWEPALTGDAGLP
jgi:uncharacterized protein YeaO (DUF488 family)